MASKLAIFGGEPAIPSNTFYPWPPITEVDEQYVLASLRGANHAFGPNCVAFEQEFAAWNGNTFAITTNSGTAALHMCVAACNCSEGDEVIVTAYSWSSSATCILHHNCIPVFVDIDWETMNIDIDKIEAAISPKTKAIIVVHLHGLAVDMAKVLDLAHKHGLKVIEQLDVPDLELLGERGPVHNPGQIGRPRVVLKHGTGNAEAGGFNTEG